MRACVIKTKDENGAQPLVNLEFLRFFSSFLQCINAIYMMNDGMWRRIYIIKDRIQKKIIVEWKMCVEGKICTKHNNRNFVIVLEYFYSE